MQMHTLSDHPPTSSRQPPKDVWRQIDGCPALGADVLVAARFAPCRERRRPLHRFHRPASALRAAWPDQQCSDVVKHTSAHQQYSCQGRNRHEIRISKASCGYKSTTDGQIIAKDHKYNNPIRWRKKRRQAHRQECLPPSAPEMAQELINQLL